MWLASKMFKGSDNAQSVCSSLLNDFDQWDESYNTLSHASRLAIVQYEDIEYLRLEDKALYRTIGGIGESRYKLTFVDKSHIWFAIKEWRKRDTRIRSKLKKEAFYTKRELDLAFTLLVEENLVMSLTSPHSFIRRRAQEVAKAKEE